ncbi:DNA methyltransferase [Ruminiclostridium cellobioparum]|uniref:DNA methyltransferase n=1 Tax=Ruminiclostridium cellobioparum TaxID=29355 RepID=UPI000E3E0D98
MKVKTWRITKLSYAVQSKEGIELNRLYQEDLSVHDWYRFVLSFPPHLVRKYLNKFNISDNQTVLDPFCGTGTTLVECKKLGIPSIGIEANPIVQLAAAAKTDWSINEKVLIDNSLKTAAYAQEKLKSLGDRIKVLEPEKNNLLIKNSISAAPLHKTLVLIEELQEHRCDEVFNHQTIALAKQIVYSYSNLHFGPEVGVSRNKKIDVPVIENWINGVYSIAKDIEEYKKLTHVEARVHLADSRNIVSCISDNSIDAVITSPPYPNEKDYTRTTRLESVLLGFINNKHDLRQCKENLLRSNTRNVYITDNDETWIKNNLKVIELSKAIENKRIELGKTSGFEKYYHRVVELYFGGIAKHLAQLRIKLRPGAKLAYVVGDQASYFRVLIKTGEIIADIASDLGYNIESIDLFRTRFSSSTGDYINENVVVMNWQG